MRLITLTLGAASILASAPGPAPLPMPEDPVDAVLAAFEQHPIVAIAEPHGLVELHEVLERIITDPRFLETVDDIVVEFAGATGQDVLDRYIAGGELAAEELSTVWHDTVVSPRVTWDSPLYAQFLQTVRAVNLREARRGGSRRLRVLAGDPPIDWPKIQHLDQLRAIWNDPELDRDAHCSRIVESQVLAHGRKALLISGGGHLTRRNLWEPPAPNPSPDTATVHLLREHPGSVFVIYTLGPRILDSEELVRRLTGVPYPRVIGLKDHWLGRWKASDFIGVRRYNVEGPGKWACEGLTFGQVADAALFLGTAYTDSLPAFDSQSESYREELNRRRRIIGAPERSRVDQGIVETGWLIDARKLDQATRAVEQMRTWESDSVDLDGRLNGLLRRIEELENPADRRASSNEALESSVT